MAVIKDKINGFIAWLDAKINKSSCYDCPCYAYEKNYFDGDISEYCMGSTNDDIHWYCLTPYFVRRWLCKHELRKRDRFVEKMMEAEEDEFHSRFCPEQPTVPPMPKERIKNDSNKV